MKPPVATYRIQFRAGMTFDRAAALLPHVKRLGVSHVYASPVFTATAGSTHGYDVTDVGQIDPAIGGAEGFARFSARLKALDLGLILDIVPNHMAASTDNGWWRDVLEKGRASAFAGHFDIDWRERLTLPHLDRPFAEAVAAGELQLAPVGGGWALCYRTARYPLSAESIRWLADETGGDPAAVAALSRSPGGMAALHERQHWRLIPWREAAHRLTYRRFFEITGLVGLRVEDPWVFDDVHRLAADLVRRGDVQGLRIDHVDGLADPAGYLRRLRRTVGEDVFIVVEKILEAEESLPADWPVAGTTGYEFIEAARHLFVDRAGLEALDGHYRRLVPSMSDMGAELWRAKTEMATVNFAGEVARLVEIGGPLLPEIGQARLAPAIRTLLAAFPVYRTYGTAGALSPADAAVLERAVAAARRHGADEAAIAAVAGLLREGRPEAAEFRTRFQQLTGPIMAKSMEDTLFYRHNRLLAANEVGCDPAVAPGGAAAFHARMLARARRWPHGLSATSTHDTKRGEDARARLYAISEEADLWAVHLDRWRRMNASFVTALPDGPAPEPNTEWMLYQALLGVLPETVEAGDLPALQKRFVAYALKAVREAKVRTDWTEPNEAYEAAVQHYAGALLSSENRAFFEDFRSAARPFIACGHLNSLAQTLFKLIAPGIPDFYQGAEGFDLSLVDPDNRRPVDYEALMKEDGSAQAMKITLIRHGLALRREKPALFLEGDYIPVTVAGKRHEYVVAFARHRSGDFALAVAPVRVAAAIRPGSLTPPPAFWEDTRLELPAEYAGPMRDICGGRNHAGAATLSLAALLARPVALLVPA